MSIEAPVTRIVVLVALALACGGAAVALLLVRASRSDATPATLHTVTALHHAAGAPKPAPAVVHRQKIVRPTLLAGLPGPIAYVLERHPAVVVALYEHGTGGGAALAEARAGAGSPARRSSRSTCSGLGSPARSQASPALWRHRPSSWCGAPA